MQRSSYKRKHERRMSTLRKRHSSYRPRQRHVQRLKYLSSRYLSNYRMYQNFRKRKRRPYTQKTKASYSSRNYVQRRLHRTPKQQRHRKLRSPLKSNENTTPKRPQLRKRRQLLSRHYYVNYVCEGLHANKCKSSQRVNDSQNYSRN